MKCHTSWALVCAVVLACSEQATAFDLLGKWCRDGHHQTLDWCRLPDFGTCDDYCRKAMPKVRPPLCEGHRDDYCAKPIPLTALPCLNGCCDDYCRKPLPCPTGPTCCYPDFYQFGPPDQPQCCQAAEPDCVNTDDYQYGPPDHSQCCSPAKPAPIDTGLYQCGPPDRPGCPEACELP